MRIVVQGGLTERLKAPTWPPQSLPPPQLNRSLTVLLPHSPPSSDAGARHPDRGLPAPQNQGEEVESYLAAHCHSVHGCSSRGVTLLGTGAGHASMAQGTTLLRGATLLHTVSARCAQSQFALMFLAPLSALNHSTGSINVPAV